VLTRNQILQFNLEREDQALNATSQRLNLITTELQAGVIKTRMQPIGVVWMKTERLWEYSRSSWVTRPRRPSCITMATPYRSPKQRPTVRSSGRFRLLRHSMTKEPPTLRSLFKPWVHGFTLDCISGDAGVDSRELPRRSLGSE
jgi:hypothetical protein